MPRTRFADQPCSVARTIDMLGDWWTPLIMREAYYGVRRFDVFQERLGIGRNVLASRLKHLSEAGIFHKVPYQERPVRHEYRLSEKGKDFFSVIAAMQAWGDKWLWDEAGPPVLWQNKHTGAPITPTVVDAHTGEPLRLGMVRERPGASFPEDPALRVQRFGARHAPASEPSSDG